MLHLKTSDYVCFLGFFVCLFVCFFFGHKQLRKNTLKVKCEKKENKMQIEHEKVLQNVYFIQLSIFPFVRHEIPFLGKRKEKFQ